MPAPKGNKYALGNNGGRPPIYSSGEEFSDKIQEYFTYCEGEFHMEDREVTVPDEDGNKTRKTIQVEVWDRHPERPTKTGLALYLGFDALSTVNDYAKKTEEFSYPIKRALMVIESDYEQSLMGQNASGAIFALKNFGWTDKQEINANVNTVGRPAWLGITSPNEKD